MQTSDEENTGSGQPGAASAGIAKKMYYSISEVCAMTGVGQHILRYWEKEFALLRPKKNSGGKRAYRDKDIEIIVKIKRMLEEDKYTLQGVKEKLSGNRRAAGGGVKNKKTGGGVGDGNAPDSASIHKDAAAKPAKRKPAPKSNGVRGADKGKVNNDSVDGGADKGEVNNNRGGGGNDYDGGGDKRGDGGAFISSIRDGLLEVLKLLE